MLHFLNDVTNDAESTQNKLINRIPGSCLLISSLPGSALRTHVESLKALPGKLDIKRHSPSILYVSIPDLCHLSHSRYRL